MARTSKQKCVSLLLWAFGFDFLGSLGLYSISVEDIKGRINIDLVKRLSQHHGTHTHKHMGYMQMGDKSAV